MFLFRKMARLLKRGDKLAVLVSNRTLSVDLEEKVDEFFPDRKTHTGRIHRIDRPIGLNGLDKLRAIIIKN